MPKVEGKMRSWQIFNFSRKHLGRSALIAIFGKKNGRAVEYWCEDPMYTDKPDEAYDPIQGVKNLLTALDDHSHTGVIRSCIAYLTADTALACGQEPQVSGLLSTIDQEVLADYEAVGEMQRAIKKGEHPAVICALMADAIAEIERTYAKYKKDFAE